MNWWFTNVNAYLCLFFLSFSPKRAFSFDLLTPDYVDGGHSANKALLFL